MSSRGGSAGSSRHAMARPKREKRTRSSTCSGVGVGVGVGLEGEVAHQPREEGAHVGAADERLLRLVRAGVARGQSAEERGRVAQQRLDQLEEDHLGRARGRGGGRVKVRAHYRGVSYSWFGFGFGFGSQETRRLGWQGLRAGGEGGARRQLL